MLELLEGGKREVFLKNAEDKMATLNANFDESHKQLSYPDEYLDSLYSAINDVAPDFFPPMRTRKPSQRSRRNTNSGQLNVLDF